MAAIVETFLELEKLAHEVEVGCDNRALLFHGLVRVHHGHRGAAHQVGDGQRGRSRHARLTVDQHAAAGLPGFLCKNRQTNLLVKCN